MDFEMDKEEENGRAPLGEMPKYALILGGSSGLGLATAKKLAAHGYHIIIVHRDKRTDLPRIKKEFDHIVSMGTRLISFNADATLAEKRTEMINEIKSVLGQPQKIHVLVHSIAKGSMKPMNAKMDNALNQQDLLITLNAMALSLYDWTKALQESDLLAADTRIVSFTSEGNTRAWPGYGAVSAAKATLEALTRNIALELAPIGVRANCIQAGLTETKAFSMIPNHEELRENALKRNPNARLTIPEDVANVVYLLTTEEARWITGTVIKVDGGESLQ